MMETVIAWIVWGLYVAFGTGEPRGFLPPKPPPGVERSPAPASFNPNVPPPRVP